MLASPLAVGALAAGPAWGHLPLAAFWFAGYFAFFAASLWLKSGRKPRYLSPARAYAVLAAVLGVTTAYLNPGLLRWAPLFLAPLGLGLWAAARRRERDLLAGLTMVLGSALMTVVADAAGEGPDLHRAWRLALVQLLYFAGTVFYVRSQIREKGNERFLRASVAVHAASTAIVLTLSPLLALVFALLTVRAAVVPRFSLSPKQIGIAEVVGVLAVAVVSLWTI
jgi:hypothetical protein